MEGGATTPRDAPPAPGDTPTRAYQTSGPYHHQRYSSSNYCFSDLDSIDIPTATVAASRFSTATTSPRSSPVRRKPLPKNATPVIPSSQSRTPLTSASPPKGDRRPEVCRASLQKKRSRPGSRRGYLDASKSSTKDEGLPFVPRNIIDRFPRGRAGPTLPHRIDTSTPFLPLEDDDYGFANGSPLHSRLTSEPLVPILPSPPRSHERANTMALQPNGNRPPPLQLDPVRSFSSSSTDSKLPKTPGNKLTSFFGWKSAPSPGAESSSTEISDDGRSPYGSSMPMPPALSSSTFPGQLSSGPIDHSISNGGMFPTIRNGSIGGPVLSEPGLSSKIAELESELREISCELAGSIRREMELEDLVERLQTEVPTDSNRRTSDYFSDSGTSSVRYGSDSASRVEDIEKIKRAAEQERAQLKVQLSQKWQEERAQRTASESHVQILENQVQQLRRERVDVSDTYQKNKELELALEETRRKLMEERQQKDNFEDLLTAMRVELEQLRHDRDYLRNDVIPSLQQRLDSGGPSGAAQAEIQKLTAEIEALKFENGSLAQLQNNRFASIAEEEGVPARRMSSFGLSRSNSLARMPARSSGLARSGSLSRSNSVSGKQRETSESLAERMKDVEAQRDALHQALKSLLDRQAYQAREYAKRIKVLELELDRAREAGSPRKLGYEREVRNLREEVNQLRQRADDALEQKWQCEKGLGGLKMDLDRAEQETASLRMLLQEHDIALPADYAMSAEGLTEVQATSSSLEAAYQQLQADREYAEASASRSMADEQGFADQLAASVTRTESLADHVRKQLGINNSLRNRLAEAIGKGERDQQLSAARINELQSRLRELEDTLMAAQHHSEEEMAKHEEEIRTLQENHNAQLLRMKNGIRTPVALSPKPPTSPFGARSPRLDKTTSGDGIPLTEAVQTETLEKRVKELEKALRDADMEMKEVVNRMNRAQIEVAELQSDRDEALRQTRKLQAEILAEREAFRALMG